MQEKRSHDLRKFWLPAFILLAIGAWQADYAMIFPLKSTLAGLAGITITIVGFYLRFIELRKRENIDPGLWRMGSRLVFTGLSFYSLHPVAITLTIVAMFYIRIPLPHLTSDTPMKKYEVKGWLAAATIFLLLNFIRDYTVWKQLVPDYPALVIYSFVLMICLSVYFNAPPPKSRS